MKILDLFLRSSFGLSKASSKEFIKQHAANLCKSFSVPADIRLDRLPEDKGGLTAPVFGDGGVVDGYRIRLNNLHIDGAESRGVLDFAFIWALVAAGHEAKHAKQIDSKDPVFALSYLAECGNDANYKTNYKFNRREIVAEKAGLEFAQEFLRMQFPGIDGDSFLLKYVNGCASSGIAYWVDAPEDGFESMEEVFQAFDDAYDAAKSHVNVYPAKVSKTCGDAFTRLTRMGTGKGLDPDWEFAYDALQVAGGQYESNMILASVALCDDPGLIKYAAGAELPDLSIKAVFGRDAPGVPVSDEPAQDSILPGRSPKMDALMKQAERDKARSPDVEGFEHTK